MRNRVARKSLKNYGAGEGNRTLVFSLEGFWRLNTFNVRSDKSSRKAPLSANGFSSLSEREGLFYIYSSAVYEGAVRPRWSSWFGAADGGISGARMVPATSATSRRKTVRKPSPIFASPRCCVATLGREQKLEGYKDPPRSQVLKPTKTALWITVPKTHGPGRRRRLSAALRAASPLCEEKTARSRRIYWRSLQSCPNHT
jgi:hypothetical protein